MWLILFDLVSNKISSMRHIVVTLFNCEKTLLQFFFKTWKHLRGFEVSGCSSTESNQSSGSNFTFCFVFGCLPFVSTGWVSVCQKQPVVNTNIETMSPFAPCFKVSFLCWDCSQIARDYREVQVLEIHWEWIVIQQYDNTAHNCKEICL